MTLTDFQTELDSLYKNRNSKTNTGTTTSFVCPITNKTFKSAKAIGFSTYYSTMTTEIKKFQAKPYKSLTEEENFDKFKLLIQNREALKNLDASFSKISDLPSLQGWYDSLIKLKNKKTTDNTLPTLVVKKIKFHKNRYYDKDLYAFIKVDNLTKESQKSLKSHLLDFVDSKNPNDLFIKIYKDQNTIAKSIYDFQTFSNTIKKVDMTSKPSLLENQEYVELTKKIKKINSELHNLREEHKKVEQKMAEIREKTLDAITYDDYIQSKKQQS